MDPIIAWLLEESRTLLTPEAFGQGLLDRLRAEGIPAERISTAFPTQHPEIAALQMSWSSDQGLWREARAHSQIASTQLRDSPLRLVLQGSGVVRRRLDAAAVKEFPGLIELRERGMTDYLLLPLRQGSGRRGFLSVTTREPAGFDDATIARLEALIPALSTRIELASAYYATGSLLEVYLGQRAAERVLSGKFLRGGGERITSAIWICDLRDFTALTGTTPVAEVLEVLDRYFECTAGAIEAEGGDVLKFIGDAVLGIFPSDGPPGPSCRAAFAAAARALSKVEAFSAERVAKGLAPVRIGLALHVGEVMFGNIGGTRRLDFTVIGPAVNEAARIEALCKPLGTPLLMSRAFVDAAGVPAKSFGAQALKGVPGPIEVLGRG